MRLYRSSANRSSPGSFEIRSGTGSEVHIRGMLFGSVLQREFINKVSAVDVSYQLDKKKYQLFLF